MSNASSPDYDGIFVRGLFTTETHTTGNFFSLGLTENEIRGTVLQASATFNGTGSLSVSTARREIFVAVEFDGAGSLAVIGGHALFAAAIFNGLGSLNINPTPVTGVRIIFNGMGHMCIEAQVRIGHGRCGVTGSDTNQVITGPGPTKNAVT